MFNIGRLAVITTFTVSLVSGVALADGGDHKKKAPPTTTPQASQAQPSREGMLLPFMSPAKGRKLFASKGCVVCHSINGVGGEDAPALDAATMGIMNPFDFAAKMWRGAATMIAVQEDELGEQIEFNGEELANIIAFVHSAEEQKKFSKADIPERITKLMGHMEAGDDDHSEKDPKKVPKE